LIAETEAGPISGLGSYDPGVLGYPALQKALPQVYEKMTDLKKQGLHQSRRLALSGKTKLIKP
jgi:hypothetical protein